MSLKICWPGATFLAVLITCAVWNNWICPAHADIGVVAKLDDPDMKLHRVYLRSTWTLEGSDRELMQVQVYLPKGDVPVEQTWELLFDSAEVMRQAVDLCRHSDNGRQVTVRGREVYTVHGKGFLIDQIKGKW